MGGLSEYLAEALKGSRETLGLTMQGLSAEQLQAAPGGTANNITSLYVHAVKGEDDLLAMAIGKPSLWASGWREKLGGTDAMEGPVLNDGMKAYKLDIEAWAPYVAALSEYADRTVRGMSDADLDGKVDFGEFGQPSVKEVIRDYITWHYAFHSGEISSQKGVMGLQGVPF